MTLINKRTLLSFVAACVVAGSVAPNLAIADGVAPVTAPAPTEGDDDIAPTPIVAPDLPAVTPTIDDVDPVAKAGDVVNLLRAGKWLPAVGAALILLTWFVLFVAGKVFKRPRSTWAKRAVAGVVASTMTFGAALEAGASLSFGLVSASLGAYWLASGGYDTLRALYTWVRKKLG